MQHFYKNIQGWSSFIPWYKAVIDAAPSRTPRSTFVELGTWKGRSAAFMAVEIDRQRKPIDFYTIDTFQGSDEPAHHEDPVIQQGRLEQVARSNLRRVSRKGLVEIVKSDSAEAANMFQDNSVDFLFIDAGHTYELVSRDIEAWWPKVKTGGIIAGDDYTWEGVQKAVLEAFGQEGTYHAWVSDIKTEFGKNGNKCWRIKKWKSLK